MWKGEYVQFKSNLSTGYKKKCVIYVEVLGIKFDMLFISKKESILRVGKNVIFRFSASGSIINLIMKEKIVPTVPNYSHMTFTSHDC